MPTLEGSYFVHADGNTNDSLVTESFAVAANDVIVVKGISDAYYGPLGVPTASGLTFSSVVEAAFAMAETAVAYIWVATAAAANTVTVTVTSSGDAVPHAMVVERWSSAYVPDADPAIRAAFSTSDPGLPGSYIDTDMDESVVTWAVVDQLAVDGSGRTYDTTSATPTEEAYYADTTGTAVTAYFAYQEAVTGGTHNFGLTSPGSQFYCLVALEVLHKEGTILREGTGTKQITGTTTIAPVYPAAIVAGRLAVAVRGQKPETSTASTETDWDRQQSVTGGTGTTGADVGQTRVTVDTRVLAGGETTPTFDQASTPNSVIAAICIYSCNAGNTWELASTTGNDTTHGTGRSATGAGSLAFAPGDVLLSIWSSDTDAATAYTAPTTTATSITFGTTSNLYTANVSTRAGATTNNDCNLLWFQTTVTAGTATSAPVFSATGGPSSCGPVAFIRLREVAAPFGATATPAVIARVVAIPAATASAIVDATATPATVARTAAIPAPSTAAGAAPTPAVIARAVVLPTVTRIAGSTTSPSAIVRTVAVNTPALNVGSTVTPTTIARVTVLPDVAASGTGVGTAAPNVIATTVTLPAATETGSSNVVPNAIPVTVALPAAAPRAGTVTSPARIICAVAIPAATATSVTDATITPAAIAATAAALGPGLTAGSAATPTVITLSIVIADPTITGGLPDEHTRRYTVPYREVTVAVWREPAGTLTYREAP